MTFYVGQKVVCINDQATPRISRWCNGSRMTRIKVGDILTVRDVDTRCVDLFGCAVLRFEGITGEMRESTVGPWESGASYPATHFRPVSNRQTDISIFTEILDRANGDRPRVREEV